LDLGGGVKLKMVRIPAKGKTFWMGSPKNEKDRNPLEKNFDAEAQHEVELSRDYYLGVTEVTQAQYRAVMGSNPSCFCNDGAGRATVFNLNTDDFPVENVSWEDAKEFCRKVGDKVQDGHTYRLPTEAEWEYACRGGDSAKDSSPFYLKGGPTSSLSGGQINFNGNYPYGDGSKGNNLGRTARCGSNAEDVNAFGLYDMHGNVAEWCEDWYGEFPKGKVVDPRGPSAGSLRVFRGGSWGSNGRYCRAAYRYGFTPSLRDGSVGCRLARAMR
jgi:formylglycine-generating enzyme